MDSTKTFDGVDGECKDSKQMWDQSPIFFALDAKSIAKVKSHLANVQVPSYDISGDRAAPTEPILIPTIQTGGSGTDDPLNKTPTLNSIAAFDLDGDGSVDAFVFRDLDDDPRTNDYFAITLENLLEGRAEGFALTANDAEPPVHPVGLLLPAVSSAPRGPNDDAVDWEPPLKITVPVVWEVEEG